MHHALILGSRVTAFLVGFVAFYIVLFLFQDIEEPVWQNRIDNLWKAVYQRSLVTNNKTTALFNKIGEVLRDLFSRLFGKSLFSFRAVATSVNFSIGGMFLFYLAAGWNPADPVDLVDLKYIAKVLVWIAPFWIAAVLPALFSNKWVVGVACLLPACCLLKIETPIFGPLNSESVFFNIRTIIPFLLVGSVLSDFLMVVVIRKLFASISETISIYRVFLIIGALVVCFYATSIFPLSAINGLPEFSFRGHTILDGGYWLWLEILNVTTGLFCLIPIPILFVVLLHKLMWPVLSRLLNPLKKFKIISNHKALLTIGSVCWAYAFNLEHVGALAILNALGK